MRRVFLLLLSVVLLAGCKEAKMTYEDGAEMASFKEPVYLLSSPDQAIQIANFLENNKEYTEQKIINYLLQVMRKSDVGFVRNGGHYGSSQAVSWLRYKLTKPRFKKDPVDSAREFIHRVATRSQASGRMYEIQFEDGKRVPVHYVLKCELLKIENAIRVHQTQEALDLQVATNPIQQSDEVPVPSLPVVAPTPVVVS